MNTYPNARAHLAAAVLNATAAASAGAARVTTSLGAGPIAEAITGMLAEVESQAAARSLMGLADALLLFSNDDQFPFTPRDPNALTWKQKRARKAERKKLRLAMRTNDPLLRENSGFGYETTRRNGGVLPPLVRKWLAVRANEHTAPLRDLVLNHEAVLAHLRERVVLP